MAFMDVTCPRCKRRLGWQGNMADRPPCKCGYRPPQAELEEADRQLQEEADRIFQALKEKRKGT